MKEEFMNIAVYCGSKNSRESIMKCAVSVGEWIAEKKHTLVYGGGDAGLMGAAAKAAFDGGAEVIGVIPANVEFIARRPQPYVTELIKAKDMADRKKTMLERADAFIALPGGIGTLDEISEVIDLNLIGDIHKKCVYFNQDGFYEPVKALYNEMAAAGLFDWNNMKFLLFSDDIAEIEAFLEE